MIEPKFRMWDPFNAVMTYSGKLGLTKFFANYEAAIEGGNEPVLEQFTDLHDNGKDLDWWEGDIFEHPSGKCVIKWYHGGLYMHGSGGYSPVWDAANWAVLPKKIGNIHEKPELMESDNG